MRAVTASNLTGHRLSRVTFVAGFLSHDGKYGRVLYTRQRSLRFESFPIHYHPNIRRYTEFNCKLHGLQWGQGGEAIWDREHVVRTISFTQKLRLLGHLKGHIYETAVGTEESLIAITPAACANYSQQAWDLQRVRQNMMRRRNACSKVDVPTSNRSCELIKDTTSKINTHNVNQ